MRYRLVYFENDKVVTGEELKVRLANEGFTVPTLPKAVWIKPEPPNIPQPGRTMDEAMQWAQYDVLFANARAKYYTDLAVRVEAVTQLANTLQNKFWIAEWKYTHKVRGQKIYEWVIGDPLKYDWKVIANGLALKSDPIEFLCNRNFGG